jgi:hypothetical protein
MEMNVGKTKVMTISRQPSTPQIMTGQNNRGMWNISNIWVMQDVDYIQDCHGKCSMQQKEESFQQTTGLNFFVPLLAIRKLQYNFSFV